MDKVDSSSFRHIGAPQPSRDSLKEKISGFMRTLSLSPLLTMMTYVGTELEYCEDYREQLVPNEVDAMKHN